MKSYKLSIMNSVIAGILVCAMLAAFGIAEEHKSSAEIATLPKSENTAAVPDFVKPSEPATPEQITSPELEAPATAPPLNASVGEPDTDEISGDGVLDSEVANRIIETAREQLGVPFKMGGSNPDEGFDSTGFVYYCLREAGIEYPRSLKSQLEYGEKVGYNDLKTGDAVYFSAESGEAASFCGIYAGGGLIIYSPVPDDSVKTANITTGYWTERFVTGIRPVLN